MGSCSCNLKQKNEPEINDEYKEKEEIERERNKINLGKEELDRERKKFKLENDELIKKYEELREKENEVKRKEEQLQVDIMKCNKQVVENNKLRDELQKTRIKEQEINKKINEINKKEDELNEMIRKINIENNEIILNKNGINKDKKELKEKEKDLINKEKIIEQKSMELKQREINLKNKERILEQKIQELNQKEIIILKREKNVENKEKIINQQNTPIIIGLNNIGATCYMNSTLQCLSNTNKLTEYFLTKYKQNPNRIMANVYHKLLLNLWNREKNNKPYSPYEFKEVLSKENPLFAGIAANDSKDLINFLIERFHQELNEVKGNNNTNNNNNNITAQNQTNEQFMLNSFLQEFKEKFNSPISDLFYGMIETKSQCQRCGIIKYNFQVYSFLEFPLQQVNQFYYNTNRRPLFNNDGTNPDVGLYECFEYYQKIDLMNGDNQMYCNICNQLCDSLYSTTVYSTPVNLIINLNRGRGAVYECKVNFPEQLNLFNFVTFKDGFTAYQLYAVICHLGPSSMSGHFVAYCRNRIDNKWYLYNDGMVSLCSKKQQYQDGMPYILFYRALGE